MKSIWTILAVVAVMNIAAISALMGWLHSSGRLSRERALAIKQVFTKTVEQERAEQALREADLKRAEEERKLAEKAGLPPKPAGEVIAEQQFRDEQKTQTMHRQQQDLENLRASLLSKLADLEARERKLVADRLAFAEERKRIAENDGQAQFKAALATLEGQKAKDAKAVLQSLITGRQMPQVVSYLAKMDEGKRSKVMAEFVKDDPAVAADLLERLRTRGMSPPGTAPDPPQAAANEPKQPERP